MNRQLEHRYSESHHRLALGIEPIDAMRRRRVPPGVYVVRDDVALSDAEHAQLRRRRTDVAERLPRMERHSSSRYVLRFPSLRDGHEERVVREGAVAPGVDEVTVRLIEARPVVTDNQIHTGRLPPRRFVPRRLRIPLLDPATADDEPLVRRIRRPALFPGAAYDVHESATVLRGRVVRPVASGEQPVRWVRVIARRAGTNVVVGRAHGDDRGEFLLILASPAAGPASGTAVSIDVTVFVADPLPVPPVTADVDPLWDLPIEHVSSSDPNDAVTRGVAPPANYSAVNPVTVTMPMGRSSSETFVIP